MHARKRATAVLTFAGLGAVAVLVVWQGADAILVSLHTAGWHLLWLIPYFLFPLSCKSVAWGLVLAPRTQAGTRRPSPAELVYGTWIKLAIDWLLPSAQLGGDIVKARWLVVRGVDATESVGGAVVDKTIQATTQLVYWSVGLMLLAVTATATRPRVGWLVLAGVGAFGVAVSVGYRLQRRGLFHLAGRVERRLHRDAKLLDSLGGAAALDACVARIYGRRTRLAAALACRLAGRLAAAGELVLVFFLIGHPIGAGQALPMHACGQLFRALAFLVPGGLGVQEGGYLLVGTAFGLSPEMTLAAVLATRFRELAIGVPGLVAWQAFEAHRVTRHGELGDRDTWQDPRPP